MRPKVLIGYDGSTEGDDALGSAGNSARPSMRGPLSRRSSRIRVTTRRGRVRQGGRSILRAIFAKARERLDGLDAQTKPMVNDSPAAGMYELVDWHKPTAIVIGSTRHGKTGRVQVGHVGGSLLSGVHCSVAVAPRGYANADVGLERIGVAIDGASESWRALTAASLSRGARTQHSDLQRDGSNPTKSSGACSRRWDPRSTEFKEKQWAHVHEDAAGGCPRASQTEPVAPPWRPGRGPVWSRPGDLDLLVLGSRGYGPVKEVLAGQRLRPPDGRGGVPSHGVPRGAGTTPLQA